MNSHQTEALEKAFDILAEHLDAFVIIGTARQTDGPDATDSYQACFKGGTALSIGLCQVHIAKTLKKHTDDNE
jgi:hypothetical protein